MTAAPPASIEAEQSVVGQMLNRPALVGEVIAAKLDGAHFSNPALRALFNEVCAAYYADDEGAINPLTMGELTSKTLARIWECQEGQAVRRVQQFASHYRGAKGAVEHAKVVKRHADYRALAELGQSLITDVDLEQLSPEELAGQAAQRAAEIATSSMLTNELITFDELGQRFMERHDQLRRAQQAGIEIGVYFGLRFLDGWIRGLRPTEMMILGGEPGAGKSAVAWKAAQNFAERQMLKPPERRLGTFVASLEMGEEPSTNRVAQLNTGLDGGKLREGKTSDRDMDTLAREWGRRKGLPMVFNHSSQMRASQLRAMCVETVRRHNTGLIVIDHMRYFDMDGRWRDPLEEEEAKARFLKESIAKELNVAVMVLAHTTKALGEDGRPRLRDLRGSYMVAAHADFVGFVYRPYEYASDAEREAGDVSLTDAELIWEKNRHGLKRPAPFHFDASTMTIR